MQLETVIFTKSDLAKYPFLQQTVKYVKQLNLKVEELTNHEMAQILNRAENRVKNAILYGVSTGEKQEDDVEIPSFPVAIILAIATKNSFIKKRYALAEAKQAFNNLKFENSEKILAIAADFKWRINANKNPAIPLEFSLSFTDYLRNTTHLRDDHWKLINRLLVQGVVYLSKHDVTRLLQEEIRRHIEKRLETEIPNLPPKITEIAEQLIALAKEKMGKEEMEGFPKVVTRSAFPPCIIALYDAASKGRHLSHVGRFTLTSFLINIGMSPEKVNELFKSFSDYNERLTRYQVEHIAGERGSRTRYTSPQCTTLQTHGVCINSDDLCRRIHHPLAYYKLKQNWHSSFKKDSGL
ncbi:MAG: DNA primase large subunit PriL [Candidatus Bathyarchaeia archaeon]